MSNELRVITKLSKGKYSVVIESNIVSLIICKYSELESEVNTITCIIDQILKNDKKITCLRIPSILIKLKKHYIHNLIKNNKTITELYICGYNYVNCTNINSARIIRAILDLQQLRVIDLSHNNLGPELGNIILHGMTINYSLANINLSNNGLGKSVEIIAKALPSIFTLATLNLSNNKLGPEEGIAIAEGLGLNNSLVELNLTDNNLGGKGGSAIAEAIRKNSTLTDINLSRNDLGVIGLTEFLSMLCKEKSNCKLTELDISINDCRDRDNNRNHIYGLLLATAIRVNTSLKTLSFYCNMLGNKEDIGLAIANALRKNTTLTKLDLRINKLGDENVLEILKSLRKNTTLTDISLSFNCENNNYINCENNNYINCENNNYINCENNNYKTIGNEFITLF